MPSGTISSRQHPIVAAFRQAAHGDATRILIDGWHLLQEARAAGIEIETVAMSRDPDALAEHVLERLDQSTRVVSVTSSVMDALSPVRTPTGVVGLARRPTVEFSRLLRPAPALTLVLVDVQDPGNVGATVRAAEAGGATGVAFTSSSADPWGWKALRGAMGSTFRLPVIKTSSAVAICETLRAAGLTLIATAPAGGTSMYAADLRSPAALLFGGEGGGLPIDLLDRVDARISIPMKRPAESLNVAVAAALIVYEARRQRLC